MPEILGGLTWPGMAAISVLPKIVFLVIIFKYLSSSFLLWWSGVSSLLIGCLGAVNQSCYKKLIAWGSVYNLGFMLLTVVAAEKVKNTFFLYATIYFLSVMSVIYYFFCTKTKTVAESSNHRHKNMVQGMMLVFIFMSFLGLPPLAGFIVKAVALISIIKELPIAGVILAVSSILLSSLVYLRTVSISFSNTKRSLAVFNGTYSRHYLGYFAKALVVLLTVYFINLEQIVSFVLIKTENESTTGI